MYNSTLTPRSKQKAIRKDFQLWNSAEIGFACQVLSWSTTVCSKYFSSPGKQRLFFFLKWRKVPSTQTPRTPHWLGVLLDNLGWVLFSHLPPSRAAAGCQFPDPISFLNYIWSGTKMAGNSLLKLTLSSSCFPVCYTVNMFACSALFFHLLEAHELSITLWAERRWWLEEQLPVHMTPHLTTSQTSVNPVGQEDWNREIPSVFSPLPFPSSLNG